MSQLIYVEMIKNEIYLFDDSRFDIQRMTGNSSSQNPVN